MSLADAEDAETVLPAFRQFFSVWSNEPLAEDSRSEDDLAAYYVFFDGVEIENGTTPINFEVTKQFVLNDAGVPNGLAAR